MIYNLSCNKSSKEYIHVYKGEISITDKIKYSILRTLSRSLIVKATLQVQSESIIKGTFVMEPSEAYCSQSSFTQSELKEAQEKAFKIMRECGRDVVKSGEFAAKYARSAPYHLFFTRVEESKETYDQPFSVTFPEILDTSLGEIVKSLHLTFEVDVDWLRFQYELAGQCTNMTILYGKRVDEEELDDNIKAIKVDMPTKDESTPEYGCHHTEMMILQYKDKGIRVIVSTANLIPREWENRTQGLWISPHLPLLTESAKQKNHEPNELRTDFKKDLLWYLRKYHNSALRNALKEWKTIVEKTDFSAVKVCLVTCIPGTYPLNHAYCGHRKLAKLLSEHSKLSQDASHWPIIAQSSSVGDFGPTDDSWLLSEIVFSLQDITFRPDFQFIYPSVENYKQSFDSIYSQSKVWCCSYNKEIHSKQQWIKSYLYQWKATSTGRDQALPHIKSYTRVSPDFKSIPWFVLTSANLSKGGWGVKRDQKYYHIANYEVGVVFFPNFITGATTFPIIDEENSTVPKFPIPYDLPLCPYDETDSPFTT